MSTAVVEQNKQAVAPATNPAVEALNKAMASVRAVLPAHITPERMTKLSLGMLRTNKKLYLAAKNNPESFVNAILSASRLGLEPGMDAHLVPFDNRKTGKPEIQMIPDYRGLMALARRSGQITSIQVNIVHENDEFDLSLGLEQTLKHKPCLDRDPGNPLLVYGVAKFVDGSHHVEWMSKSQVDAVRARSRSAGNGPWVTDYEEMMRKTLVRRLTKYLPRSIELQMAEKLADAADSGHFANLENIDGEFVVIEEDDDGQQGGDQPAPPPKQTATEAAKERLRAGAKKAETPQQIDPKAGQQEPGDLLDQQQATSGPPRVSRAEVAEKLRAAATHDALDEYADLIQFVTNDPGATEELSRIYKARRATLDGLDAHRAAQGDQD